MTSNLKFKDQSGKCDAWRWWTEQINQFKKKKKLLRIIIFWAGHTNNPPISLLLLY